MQMQKKGIVDVYELTPLQQGMLFHTLYSPASAAYNIQMDIALEGELDTTALERSWACILERHAPLRTSFVWERVEKPYQVVRDDVVVEIARHDLAGLDAEEQRLTLQALLEADRAQPFDLKKPPLMRLMLVALGPRLWRLVWTFHHIILEGWSAAIVQQELWAAYREFRAQRAPALPPAPAYIEYIRWLKRQDQGQAEAYWRDVLAGVQTATPLPIDRSSAAEVAAVHKTDARTLELSEELTRALKDLARRHRVTLNTVVQGMWAILLGRYSGEDDIVFGAAVSGRPPDLPDAERIVGLFVNVLPVRIAVPPERALGEWLRDVQLGQARMRQYEYSALMQVKSWSALPGGQPLFTTAVAFENWLGDLPEDELAPGLRVARLDSHQMSDQPLTLFVAPGARLALTLMYDVERFDADAIERMAGHCRTLLEGMCAAADATLGALPWLTAAERSQLLEAWSGPRVESMREQTVVSLFAEQVGNAPDADAIVSGNRRLSYAALDAQSEQLARELIALGVGPDVPVAVLMERAPEMFVALLAILKAGGAYVPIDPEYPAQRIAFILRDTRAPILLTQSHLSQRVPDYAGRRLHVDAALPAQAAEPAVSAPRRSPRADDLAYVIYTSGSTGEPKGVAITHRGLMNLVAWHCRAYQLGPADRTTHLAGLGFDASVWELWPTLCAGASLYPVPDELRYAPAALLRWFAEQGITLAFLPTPLAEAALREPLPARLALRALLTGGDRLHGGLRRAALPFRLVNHYGPTENSVVTTCADVDPLASAEPPIGKPIDNVRVYVLDARMQPVPVGVAGELYIGGESLARGYLNRPELSAEKFVADPFGAAGGRLYRTGDTVRWRADGMLDFLGRRDHQVKVRGFRIELGEIESALSQQVGVRAAAVVLRQDTPGEPRLVAYLVPQPGSALDTGALRAALQARLPEYMVPSAFVSLSELPLTPNGKVDLKALPAPEPGSTGAAQVSPRSDLERRIAAAWCAVLKRDAVGIRDNFFDLGGHSLLMAKLQARLAEDADIEVPMVDLFRHPTVEALARHLDKGADAPAFLETVRARVAARAANDVHREAIAIVGIAGRFPGADSVARFWENLAAGAESIRFFSAAELRDAGVPETAIENPHYVPARGWLADADLFDAGFFGYSPREAELIDPQQRVFLECAWEALEDAGIDPERYPGRIGVYAGSSLNTYFLNQIARSDALAEAGMQGIISSDKDFLPTRVSYKLNLRGPSVNVQTACSTSLVAVHQACRSLLDGECDAALAGGASVLAPRIQGYLHQEQSILSPDGHCRAFSADANGTVGGEGVAVVVLKRLSDALADGDSIRAVIRGTAINNDGSHKVGYTAPSVDGQAEVIALAQIAADVTPDSIGYVETHGTGTALGDPIEVAALTQVFAGARPSAQRCALGAVKTNIGHLDAAAGVTGLIKAALALQHRQIPPTLNFTAPNPKIDFAAGPFYVNASLTDWAAPEGAPRRAAVSSFGIGGTNAHAVLEEAPPQAHAEPTEGAQILVLSARTETALDAATRRLAAHLRAHPELRLADVAWTLQTGRRMFNCRRMLVCSGIEDAAQALEMQDVARMPTARGEPRDSEAVFMFSGQGAQYPNMTRDLYRRHPQFREQVDRCCELLRPHLEADLRTWLYPQDAALEAADAQLRQTRYAQPALFVIEYALAQLWMSWGVTPQALIGHSIGEYVAACLSGVMSLEDVLALVAARGRLMQAQAPGSMLSVALSADELQPLLDESLCIAAVNAPGLCVVSGPTEAVEALEQRLAAAGHGCRRLHTSHAFHSAMMEPAVEAFTQFLAGVRLQPPRIPFVSNHTGTWITAAEAVDPRYWGRHLRHTVRFAEGIGLLLQEPNRCFIEVGPGNALATFVGQHPDCAAERVVLTSVRHPRQAADDSAFLLEALGRLWLSGRPLAWTPPQDGDAPRRIPLPTYPFERERYWIDAGSTAPMAPAAARSADAGKRADVAQWCYVPGWASAPAFDVALRDASCFHGRWLIFADADSVAWRLADGIAQRGGEVIRALPGDNYARRGEGTYSLNPACRDDYARLCAEAYGDQTPPQRIVHAWGAGDGARDTVERQIECGFQSLVFLTQAFAQRWPASRARLDVVTESAVAVDAQDVPLPARAMALGACKVIPQELPELSCRNIDIAAPRGDAEAQWLNDALLGELSAASTAPLSAYRQRRRWVQTFERLPLDQYSDDYSGATRLRHRGAYLITGGLGEVGLVFAEHLACAVQARLILTGRSELPPRAEWEAWLATHADDGRTAARLRRLLALEALGAEVMTAAVDVADPAAMQALVAAASERFGDIHGVIHAAGVVGGESFAPIEALNAAACAAQFRPKVHGLRVLHDLFADRPLDFMMPASSISTVLGGLRFAAYAAANQFMDGLSQREHALGRTHWLSVDWDGWRFDAESADAADGSVAALAITPGEGSAIFERILRLGRLPQLVVSTGDLAARIAQWVQPNGQRAEATPATAPSASPRHARPRVSTELVAPANETEQRIAALWCELFNIETVGIRDNFFELGGHSLLAVQAVSRMREQFGVGVSIDAFLELGSIERLAAHVDARRWVAEGGGGAGAAPAAETEAERYEFDL